MANRLGTNSCHDEEKNYGRLSTRLSTSTPDGMRRRDKNTTPSQSLVTNKELDDIISETAISSSSLSSDSSYHPKSLSKTNDDDLKLFTALLDQKHPTKYLRRDYSRRDALKRASDYVPPNPLFTAGPYHVYSASRQSSRFDDDDLFSKIDGEEEQERHISDIEFSEESGEEESFSKIQDVRTKTIPNLETPATFASAQSYLSSKPPATSYLSRALTTEASPFSLATFATAPSYLSIGSNGQAFYPKRQVLTVETQHTSRARAAGLLGNSFNLLDWSGFGMHIQLHGNHEAPLTLDREIARTNRAVVSSVFCRRVRLARKTMLCHRRFTADEAFEEVKHLHKLQHSHIVRLVGSYMQRRYLSILTYPVADFDLDTYLRFSEDNKESSGRSCALMGSFGCLVSALSYVHKQGIKHMDVKPKNILVRKKVTPHRITVFLTDFGISRTIMDEAATETDGPTGRTEMYCSPEVANGEPRGRSSDVFSLGCVFAEMLTIMHGKTLEEFEEWRTDDGKAFYRNLSLVDDWVVSLPSDRSIFNCPSTCLQLLYGSEMCDVLGAPYVRDFFNKRLRATIRTMLNHDKRPRPSLSQLGSGFPFGEGDCCTLGPTPFVCAHVIN